MKNIIVREAAEPDGAFAKTISDEMEASAIARGSGISKRSPESIRQKIIEGKAIIAVTENNEWVGFSYIEVWAGGEFISNSGLIVAPAHRGEGVARQIKEKTFALARKLYPAAKVFSITTGLAIMKMNAQLGFETVTYNEIPSEENFWKGCASCVNYDILNRKKHKNCLCTAMLYTPDKKLPEQSINTFNKNEIMNTLLNFTPRLVAIILFVFSGVSLMANSTAATTTAPGQSTVQVAIEFVILLFFILFPLFIKRSADRKTAK